MGSKALIAILGIAILFVCVVDPQKEKGHASSESSQSQRDQALIDSLSKVNEGFERMDGTVSSIRVFQQEVSKAVVEQGQSLVSIEKRLAEVEKGKFVSSESTPPETKAEESKATEPGKEVKASSGSECSCGPDCPCRQKTTYPSVSSVSYGSAGSSVKASYGSTGSSVKSGYGSSGSTAVGYGSSESVASSYPVQSQPRTRTPVRTAMRAVASVGHWSHDGEPIDFHLSTDHARELAEMGIDISGMTREQMLDLHDSLHKGQAVSYQPSHQARAPVFDFRSDPVPVAPIPLAAAESSCPYGGSYVNGQWVCNTSPVRATGWYPGKNLGRNRR